MSEPSNDDASPSPNPTLQTSPQRSMGKYRILARVGQGGNGIVYRAYDTVLNRTVALKILPRMHADNPIALERLLREARAAAGINHPHVVTVHDVLLFDDEFLLIMEFIPGGKRRGAAQAARAGCPGRKPRASCETSAGVWRPPTPLRPGPPRHQAGQHPADGGRPAQDRRLRARQESHQHSGGPGRNRDASSALPCT